jgi:hypothetical protein
MEMFSTWPLFNLLLVFTGAFILGLAKAGLRGIDMLNVTLMALVFGSKASTGIVLPLLCAADIVAVIYYHRHAQWKHFWKLVPWMAAGILIGVFAGKDMNEAVFQKSDGDNYHSHSYHYGSNGDQQIRKCPYSSLVCCWYGCDGRYHYYAWKFSRRLF